jgi:acetylornithine/N-succinyldiaminopimelate aminotransferase
MKFDPGAEKKLLLNTYERNPILFVRGSGVYLRDEQGDGISTCSAASASMALGYAHPAVNRGH